MLIYDSQFQSIVDRLKPRLGCVEHFICYDSAEAAQSFEELYDETSNELLKETGKESFDAIKMLQKTDVKNYKPANSVVYPNSALGNELKQIAQVLAEIRNENTSQIVMNTGFNACQVLPKLSSLYTSVNVNC